MAANDSLPRCDICNDTKPGRIVPVADFREAVQSQGFDPFSTGLFPRSILEASGQTVEQAAADWRPMVEDNVTDWNLCPRCYGVLSPYLERSKAAGPSLAPAPANDPDFSTPRDLSGGVSAFVVGEWTVQFMMLIDLVRQGDTQFRCYEFRGTANPALVVCVVALPLLTAMAERDGRRLLYAANTRAMLAAAQSSQHNLAPLASIEYCLWSEVATWPTRDAVKIQKHIIIGDLDFEPSNRDGVLEKSAQTEVTVKGVEELSRSPGVKLIAFHRNGWKSPFAFKCDNPKRAKETSSPVPTSSAPPLAEVRAAPQNPALSRPTKVIRSWKLTFQMLGGAALAMAGCVALFANDHAIFGSIVGLIAFVALIAAFCASGTAPCPVCGTNLGMIGKGTSEHCPECERYLRAKEGLLTELAPDTRDIVDSFGIVFPNGVSMRMPSSCCACGQTATRSETIVAENLPIRLSVNVPHCASCMMGATINEIRYTPRMNKIGDTESTKYGLLVRSYRFYRECLQINGRWKTF